MICPISPELERKLSRTNNCLPHQRVACPFAAVPDFRPARRADVGSDKGQNSWHPPVPDTYTVISAAWCWANWFIGFRATIGPICPSAHHVAVLDILHCISAACVVERADRANRGGNGFSARSCMGGGTRRERMDPGRCCGTYGLVGDLARFGQMFLSGGVSDGMQVLRPHSVWEMCRLQTASLPEMDANSNGKLIKLGYMERHPDRNRMGHTGFTGDVDRHGSERGLDADRIDQPDTSHTERAVHLGWPMRWKRPSSGKDCRSMRSPSRHLCNFLV